MAETGSRGKGGGSQFLPANVAASSSPSSSPSSSSGSRWRRYAARIAHYIPSALTLIGLILFRQFAVTYWEVKEFILPSPLRAVEALFDPRCRWGMNIQMTLTSVPGAFFFTTLAGLLPEFGVVTRQIHGLLGMH